MEHYRYLLSLNCFCQVFPTVVTLVPVNRPLISPAAQWYNPEICVSCWRVISLPRLAAHLSTLADKYTRWKWCNHSITILASYDIFVIVSEGTKFTLIKQVLYEQMSSSSFHWFSMANAPNVLQPYWLIVLPLDVPDLTASLLLWGPNRQRWNYMGQKWSINFAWKCPTST